MNRFVVTLLCLWLGCVAAEAQPTPELDALNNVLHAKRVNDTTNHASWRLSLATALNRYCESVLLHVPRNTPKEDQWLDAEWADLGKVGIQVPQKFLAELVPRALGPPWPATMPWLE
jgi:hypothetical protein